MFVFLFVIFVNNKIYSAAQNTISVATDTESDLRSRSVVSCNQIPDYNARAFFKDRGKINNTAVAGLNNLLSKHGDYEFSPRAYIDITHQTNKHGMPIDIAFSRETQTAAVTWRREKSYGVFRSKEKTKILSTTELPVAQPASVLLPIRSAPAPAPTSSTGLEIPNITIQQPQRVGMSRVAANAMLSREFSKFTEITRNFYLAPAQFDQIVTDLEANGPASFETREDDHRILYLLVKWNETEKIYPISHRRRFW